MPIPIQRCPVTVHEAHEFVFPVEEIGVVVAGRNKGMVPENQRQIGVRVSRQLSTDEGEFAAVQPGMIAVRPENAERIPGIVSSVDPKKVVFTPGTGPRPGCLCPPGRPSLYGIRQVVAEVLIVVRIVVSGDVKVDICVHAIIAENVLVLVPFTLIRAVGIPENVPVRRIRQISRNHDEAWIDDIPCLTCQPLEIRGVVRTGISHVDIGSMDKPQQFVGIGAVICRMGIAGRQRQGKTEKENDEKEMPNEKQRAGFSQHLPHPLFLISANFCYVRIQRLQRLRITGMTFGILKGLDSSPWGYSIQ